MIVHQYKALSDNYNFILHDESSHLTLVIDPSSAETTQAQLDQLGLKVDYLLITHHHFDHVGGIHKLVKKYNCPVYCSEYDMQRIPGATHGLREGEQFRFGEYAAEIILLKGHTNGSIAYWFKSEEMLFSADVLFGFGCGRLLEGTAEQMHTSLNRIKQLPNETKIYCAHDYAENNLNFCISLNDENKNFYQEQLDKKNFTIPLELGFEKVHNPFLYATSVDEFAKIRSLKDIF